MPLTAEIAKAIDSHQQWKVRLASAIESGTSEFNVANILVDDHCEFGQWLYGPAIPPDQKTAHYENCRRLHSEFHRVAAETLHNALSGNADLARVTLNNKFIATSHSLISAMRKWQDSIA